MQPSPRAPSLKGQILTCLLFVIAAVAITSILHPSPRFSEWRTGKPIEMQLLLAAAFAAISAVGVTIMLSVSALTKLIQVPSAIRALDLSGTTPWIVGLCAGIGEELLFRAALQPLVGLWIGALIFASAHARTAIIGTPSNAKRVGYLLNVFIAGVALGLVFEHFGLLAAVLMHATIDVAGLLVCRNLAARRVESSRSRSNTLLNLTRNGRQRLAALAAIRILASAAKRCRSRRVRLARALKLQKNLLQFSVC